MNMIALRLLVNIRSQRDGHDDHGGDQRYGGGGREKRKRRKEEEEEERRRRNRRHVVAPLRRLLLHGDVGGWSARGEDMSGVETLALALVHPDTAVQHLDVLTVGSGQFYLPIAHLKGLPVECASNFATQLAVNKCLLTPSSFASPVASSPGRCRGRR